MPSTQTDRLYGENSSVAIKAPVLAVCATNLPLSGLATFTTAQGASYTPAEGDRILCIGETDQTTNGIYSASQSAWQRTGDFDGAYDITQGTFVVALLSNGGTLLYQLTTADPVIGTSALTFVQYLNPNQNYPRSAAETAAGVNPVSFGYIWGDVRRYGAAVDGLTDDAAAVQIALNLGASHATQFPGGTCMVGTTLQCVAGGRVRFAENSTLKALATLAGAVLEANTLDDVQIEGSGIVDGNSAANGTYGIYAYQATHFVLHGLRVTNCKSSGIELSGTATAVAAEQIGTGNAAQVTFTKTLAHAPVQPGSVTFTAGAITGTDDGTGRISGAGVTGGINYDTGSVSLTYSAAPANGTAVDAAYTYFTPTAFARVENCRADHNGGGGFECIYCTDSGIVGCESDHNNIGTTGGQSWRLKVVGCSIHHNTNDGLAFGNNCAQITYSGNTSCYNGAEGLNFDGVRHSTMVGNTSYQNLIGITNWNRSPGNTYAGYNTVTGNTVYQCYQGIIVADNQPGEVIADNVVRDCGASFQGVPSGVGNSGILVQSCPDFRITGNQVRNNTAQGITMNSCIGGSIEGNTVADNGQYGIDLETGSGAARITVRGNTVKGNGDGVTYVAGIYNRASSQIWILDNTLIEENNPGVQHLPIDSTVAGCIIQGNVRYSLNGYGPSITAGNQRGNDWNYQGGAPTGGVWGVGDIVWNSAPGAGGAPGWICVAGGSPGTWKAMANVSA